MSDASFCRGHEILMALLGGEENYLKTHDVISRADRQSANLLYEVSSHLSDSLSISEEDWSVLVRLRGIVRLAKEGVQPDLLRNEVSKAANTAGIKLPSAMF